MAEPKQAVQCTDCRTTWYGRPGDVCRVCVEDRLAREHGIFPEKGGRL